MRDISEVVHRKAVAAGAVGWVDRLDDLISGLERDWGITVGGSMAGGTEAYVAEAETADGTPAVLKLVLPRSESAAQEESTVLQLAAGDGCVELLRADRDRGALLLERLGRPLGELALPVEQRDDILVAAAARVWRRAEGCGLPTGADKGRWLQDFIATTWEALDHPSDVRTVDHALGCAERRIAAHDDQRAVLVHGNVHRWNALSTDGGWKLIDPDGLLAEAEYDLGVVLREAPVDSRGGDPLGRARLLGAGFGLHAEAVWEWAAVERVSTGLLCTQAQLQQIGRTMLATADLVAFHTLGQGQPEGWSG